MSKETVYGQTVCEECDRWTEVVYKCYVGTPYAEAFVPAYNVVYKCHECAFDGTND